jgi:hypothetical protein
MWQLAGLLMLLRMLLQRSRRLYQGEGSRARRNALCDESRQRKLVGRYHPSSAILQRSEEEAKCLLSLSRGRSEKRQKAVGGVALSHRQGERVLSVPTLRRERPAPAERTTTRSSRSSSKYSTSTRYISTSFRQHHNNSRYDNGTRSNSNSNSIGVRYI